MATKHILFLFPVWIFFLRFSGFNKINKIKTKLTYLVISYGLAVSSFSIEIIRFYDQRKKIFLGIMERVLRYRSSDGVSLFVELITALFPKKILVDMLDNLPVFSGYVALFILFLIIVGIILGRTQKKKKYILPLYLLSTYALTTSIAPQYIAIMLPVAAIFYSSVPMLLFTIGSFAYLVSGGAPNISDLEVFSMNLVVLRKFDIPFFPWNVRGAANLLLGQAWALVLFIFYILQSLFTLKLRKDIATSHIIKAVSFFKKNFYKVVLIANVVMTFSILFYIVLRSNFMGGAKIHIVEASYGLNCGAERNNYIEIAGLQCEGEKECFAIANDFDPVVRCGKEYIIKWTCDANKLVYPVYFIKVEEEAYKVPIKLFCPAGAEHRIRPYDELRKTISLSL